MKDKQFIETGKQLTDVFINFACGLLKKQYPQFGGFQTTLLQNSKLNSQLRNPKHAIQVGLWYLTLLMSTMDTLS